VSWINRAGSALGLGDRRKEAPWGDGWLDEGWDDLGGTIDWANAAADELVFLWPRLRPAGFLPALARDRLLPLVIAARLRAGTAADEGPVGRSSLAVLARAEEILDGNAGPWRNAGLIEAVILSFEAGINGAYVVAAADLLHESLAACAWLGILCRGRDCLLPPVLAPAVRDFAHRGPGLGRETTAPDLADAYAMGVALMGARLEQVRLSTPIGRALRTVDKGAIPLVRGAGTARASRGALPAALVATLENLASAVAPPTGGARAGSGGTA
jgi:hypothetical protein